MELIGKHEFAKAALDENSETFVVHVAAIEAPEPAVHPSRALLLAALQQDKALTETSLDYTDYTDVFSFDLAIKLPENTSINEHAIELVGGKSSPYGPIYSLSRVELETVKTYIETHLKTGFIPSSESLACTPIFFDKKSDYCLRWSVNYRDLNNLIIRNRYPLPLIGESLDRLSRAKRFT